MVTWKRCGVFVVQHSQDHWPRHVHIFEDGKRTLRFNLDKWKVMDGQLTSKAKTVLERLKIEGVFDEKSKI